MKVTPYTVYVSDALRSANTCAKSIVWRFRELRELFQSDLNADSSHEAARHIAHCRRDSRELLGLLEDTSSFFTAGWCEICKAAHSVAPAKVGESKAASLHEAAARAWFVFDDAIELITPEDDRISAPPNYGTGASLKSPHPATVEASQEVFRKVASSFPDIDVTHIQAMLDIELVFALQVFPEMTPQALYDSEALKRDVGWEEYEESGWNGDKPASGSGDQPDGTLPSNVRIAKRRAPDALYSIAPGKHVSPMVRKFMDAINNAGPDVNQMELARSICEGTVHKPTSVIAQFNTKLREQKIILLPLPTTDGDSADQAVRNSSERLSK